MKKCGKRQRPSEDEQSDILCSVVHIPPFWWSIQRAFIRRYAHYNGHKKGRIIEVTNGRIIEVTKKGRIIKVIKKKEYRGHKKGSIIEVIEKSRARRGKKNYRLKSKKKNIWGQRRTPVRTSQSMKLLPVCSNGTEMDNYECFEDCRLKIVKILN